MKPTNEISISHINNLIVLILAGGQGTRLWPLSRENLPKQFIPLAANGNTLLQESVRRSIKITGSIEQIMVVTQERQADIVRQQIPDLPGENLISEPCGRNTAASICLSALFLQQREENPVMLVIPSDHLFIDEDPWIEAISVAYNFAQGNDKLVTIGIKPLDASPNYGYIKIGNLLDQRNLHPVFQVEEFVEKPDGDTAQKYIDSQNYLWNTGTFAWQISAFVAACKQHIPDIYLLLEKSYKSPSMLKATFSKIPNVSIDIALLEKARNVATVRGNFQRIDVGNLTNLNQILLPVADANYSYGHLVTKSSFNNVAYTDEGLIGLIGVDDLIVIRRHDVVLVCSSSHAAEVKELIAQLDQQGMVQYK